MREPIQTETYKGYTIKIFNDEDPQNPIKDWDMLGTFSCLNRNYDLSCKKNEFKDRESILEHIKRKDVISLPLYTYEHGGITISTGKFSCPWDSGQAGYIHVTKEDIRKEYSAKRVSKQMIEKAIKVMQGEVKIFDQYLQGDVYGHVIEDSEGNEVDSCWGFMPSKMYGKDELVTECQSIVDAIEQRKFEKYGKQAEMEFAE